MTWRRISGGEMDQGEIEYNNGGQQPRGMHQPAPNEAQEAHVCCRPNFDF
jgi:hypothetical protein